MRVLIIVLAGLWLLAPSVASAQTIAPETLLANDADRSTDNTVSRNGNLVQAVHNVFETDAAMHLDHMWPRCWESRDVLATEALEGQHTMEAQGVAYGSAVNVIEDWDGLIPSTGFPQNCAPVLAHILANAGVTPSD